MSIKDAKIIATPDALIDHSQSVTLHVTGANFSSDNGLTFRWTCRKYSNSKLQSDYWGQLVVIWDL